MGFKAQGRGATRAQFDVVEVEGAVVASVAYGDKTASIELSREILGNYAGRDIYVSASGRYAAAAMYSGQSENAYAVFDIVRGIRPLVCSKWEFGYCMTAAFSPQEDVVVFSNTLNPMLGSDDETPVRGTLHWAQLEAFWLPAGTRQSFVIEAEVSGKAGNGYFDSEGESYLREVSFEGEVVAITTPWGERATVSLESPSAAITVRGPAIEE